MKCVAWKSNQAVELCTTSSFIKGFCSAYKITSASHLYATYAQHGVHSDSYINVGRCFFVLWWSIVRIFYSTCMYIGLNEFEIHISSISFSRKSLKNVNKMFYKSYSIATTTYRHNLVSFAHSTCNQSINSLARFSPLLLYNNYLLPA